MKMISPESHGSQTWKNNYDLYVDQAENIERIMAPILSMLSIALNISLAFYIICRSDLRKFTFLIVAFQMLVDGLVVSPVNILCQLARFHYPRWTGLNPDPGEGSNSTGVYPHERLGCYLTAVYNGANITTTSPVLLFLCVERAMLVLLPVDGKILMRKLRLKVFVTVNIGTSIVYTSLLVLGTSFDPSYNTCDLTVAGLSRQASAFLFVTIFYLIPLSSMLILYPLIVRKLLINRVPLPEHRVALNQRISTLLIFSTIAFALLWAPLMVPSFWQAIETESWMSFSTDHPMIFKLYATCNLFILSYSVVNPCIFALITRPIREPLFLEVQSYTCDLLSKKSPDKATHQPSTINETTKV